MSPEVKEAREKSGFNYFVVDLRGRREFDPAAFDDQARKVGGEPARECSLKYIIANNRMFIFRDMVGHEEVFEKIVKPNFKNPYLQSAGSIRVVFGDNGVQRIIHGTSNSLLGELPLTKSEEYKFGTLRKKLGKSFKFELPHIAVLPNAY